MFDEPITAAMVANYLQTEVTPGTPVVLTEDEWADGGGEGDFVGLDRVLHDIAHEPERYQEPTR